MFGNLSFADQRSRARLDTKCPIRTSCACPLLQPLQSPDSSLSPPGATGGLDQFGQHYDQETHLLWVFACPLRCHERTRITAQTVVQKCCSAVTYQPQSLGTVPRITGSSSRPPFPGPPSPPHLLSSQDRHTTVAQINCRASAVSLRPWRHGSRHGSSPGLDTGRLTCGGTGQGPPPGTLRDTSLGGPRAPVPPRVSRSLNSSLT